MGDVPHLDTRLGGVQQPTHLTQLALRRLALRRQLLRGRGRLALRGQLCHTRHAHLLHQAHAA